MKRLAWLTATALILAIPSIASAENGSVTGTIHLRGAPVWDSALLVNVPNGTRITIAGCTDRWDWCQVSFGGDRGWVPSYYLLYDLLGQEVPVATYAKRTGLPVIGGGADSGKSQKSSSASSKARAQSQPSGKQPAASSSSSTQNPPSNSASH